jgi:hypothetical protein
MNRFSTSNDCVPTAELERVIEPLASFICAMERPQAVLRSALAMLSREVEGTHAAALAQFQNWRQN